MVNVLMIVNERLQGHGPFIEQVVIEAKTRSSHESECYNKPTFANTIPFDAGFGNVVVWTVLIVNHLQGVLRSRY